MLNLGFIILLSFVLVYLNIIILNEETLILICFLMFCWIAYNRLGKSIFEEFNKDSKKIEDLLFKSLEEVSNLLHIFLNYQSVSKNLTNNFKELREHFIKLGFVTLKKLPIYVTQKYEIVYPQKLLFTERLEKQTSKLLVLLLNQKLNKITNIQSFYTYNLKIRNFLCINKIILREYLKSI
nr:ATP synthase F0 subunit b [Hypnea sp.]